MHYFKLKYKQPSKQICGDTRLAVVKCNRHPLLFGHRNSHYDLRGNDILKLPKANTTTYGLKSWRFMAPKLWNSKPDSFRTIRPFKVFKKT